VVHTPEEEREEEEIKKALFPLSERRAVSASHRVYIYIYIYLYIFEKL